MKNLYQKAKQRVRDSEEVTKPVSSVLQDISGKDQPLEGVCLSLLFVAAHRWSGSDDLSMN